MCLLTNFLAHTLLVSTAVRSLADAECWEHLLLWLDSQEGEVSVLSSQDVEDGCRCESILHAGHCDLPCTLQGRLMYKGIWTGLYDHLLVITRYRNILSLGEKDSLCGVESLGLIIFHLCLIENSNQ